MKLLSLRFDECLSIIIWWPVAAFKLSVVLFLRLLAWSAMIFDFFVCLFFVSCLSLSVRKLQPVGRSAICRRCKQRFELQWNTDSSCSFHKGRFIGAENSKHYGTKSGEGDRGLSVFWDCCDQNTRDGPGCMKGKHLSYDEEDEDSFMLNKELKQQKDYYIRRSISWKGIHVTLFIEASMHVCRSMRHFYMRR